MQREKLINRIIVLVGIAAVIAIGAVIILRGGNTGGGQQFITYATLEPTAAPEPEETDEPDIEPEPEATSLTETYSGLRTCVITAAGNITVTSDIMNSAYNGKKYDFSPMFDLVAPYIEKGDIAVTTVTGPMGGEGTLGYSDYPQFNTPDTMIDAVKKAGIDMLALSNRHSLDTLFDGFKNQISVLEQKKMDYFGGATSAESDIPAVRSVGGINVGFLNYTDSLNGMDAYSENAALAYGVNLIAASDVKTDVRSLREAGAEVIVAYVLWGDDDSDSYNAQQKNLCKKMADAGVDVIFGAGPQSVQPVFRVAGKGGTGECVCACSLGNFLTSVKKGEDGSYAHADSGILLSVTFQETDLGKIEVLDVRYLPTYIWNDAGSNGYRVLCAADSLEVMPQGMTEDSYQRMNEAYQETLFTLANGIGVNDVSGR